MNKALLSLITVFLISGSTFASYFAVAPCKNETSIALIDRCEKAGLNILGGIQQNGYVIVDAAPEVMNTFCYYAPVRMVDQYLCYNTNSLLVKTTRNAEALIKEYQLVPNRFIPELYSLELNVRNEKELNEVKAVLMERQDVDYVSYNQVFTMDLNVNDPLYPRQWALENTGSALQYNGTAGADMNVDSAWMITTGIGTVNIAILDSGVDTLHEDLVDNMLPGFDGFADSTQDTHGYPTPNFSMDGHGTSCAGIAAAAGDNNLGIAGVAYGSKIIPVRIFYYQDYGAPVGVQATTSTEALIDGAAYAWRDAGADILSSSAGLPDLYIGILGVDTVLMNAELAAAANEARNWRGLAMFFSTGNDNASDVLWPAKLANTIGIGASSMCDERKSTISCDGEQWGSNYGDGLDVMAPGVKISTTDMTGSAGYSGGSYTYTFNGTSAACPNAAGVGALILSVNYNLSGEDVRAIINMTADRVPGYTYDSISPYGTWNNAAGHGRVNAYAAVQMAQSYTSTASIGETDELTLSIYPNPTDDRIYIYSGGDESGYEVQITDAKGKVIYESSINTSGVKVVDLEVDSGVYFVRLSSEGREKVVRVIKK